MPGDVSDKSHHSSIALIGAFNDDYIIRGRAPTDVVELLDRSGIKLRPFRENAISAEIGDKLLGIVQPILERHALGGALYHTIRGLSQYTNDINLKVIGSLGAGQGNESHQKALRQLNVDLGWLTVVDRRSALSLCFEHDGGRTLLTTPASNSSVLDLLSNRRGEIQQELAGVDIVHFNSFIEDGCQRAVASLLRDVLGKSDKVLISFDPGSDWRAGESKTLSDILSLTSILHLKSQAFNEIGRHLAGEEPREVAKRLFSEMRGPTRRILVRSDGKVTLYMDGGGDEVIELHFSLGNKGAHSEQIFQTGEGHVFTGVFLASMVSKPLVAALATRHAMFVIGRTFSEGVSKPECQISAATDAFLDQRLPSIGLMSANEYCSLETSDASEDWGNDESGSS